MSNSPIMAANAIHCSWSPSLSVRSLRELNDMTLSWCRDTKSPLCFFLTLACKSSAAWSQKGSKSEQNSHNPTRSVGKVEKYHFLTCHRAGTV
jgi:hypothetical protein